MTRPKPLKVLAIVGPTASGKSALGVTLAKRFGGEIISADSRQVYRGLDIGTGKISKREMRGVPHYLLNIASPKKILTAKDFVRTGDQALAEIFKNKHLPIIVGGTGFYIDALLGRISLPDVPPNEALREKLARASAPELFSMLEKIDPKRAKSMNTPSERNNKHRLIRAVEIARAAKAASAPAENRSLYDVFWIGVDIPKRRLEGKIKSRLHERIKRGMIGEGKRLHARGLSYKRMEALGLEYRALARLLQNKIDRAQFEADLFREIRKYAKRQVTYWKRNKKIHWFDPSEARTVTKAIEIWLKK